MFILFRPRDIVSGDFYWIRKKEDKIIFIAADCTGHGVPGAFMSMLGISLLNEIVLNMSEIRGADILNTLRKGIIKSLHQTGEIGGSQDGMDVSMVIIDKKAEFAEFTGANNPLILVRKIENDFSEFKNEEDFKFMENPETKVKLIDFKADKMPVGISRKIDTLFTSFKFRLFKDDIMYIFSDGYPDQFGGQSGKKFMIKSLKELFTQIYIEDFNNHKQILNLKMEDWLSHPKKDGGLQEQIDDILMIGIKI